MVQKTRKTLGLKKSGSTKSPLGGKPYLATGLIQQLIGHVSHSFMSSELLSKKISNDQELNFYTGRDW